MTHIDGGASFSACHACSNAFTPNSTEPFQSSVHASCDGLHERARSRRTTFGRSVRRDAGPFRLAAAHNDTLQSDQTTAGPST